ncbi:Alpha-tubulin N-acetyltransferase 1 [Allomyces arbusculus]|nr:Alpha-tubulin N-acetyltransferase 1 [Allomyces arbusculus]
MDVSNDLVASFLAEGAVSVVQASAFRPPALCTVQQRQRQEQFRIVLDALGAASAKAQCLKTPITSVKRLLDTDHRIYMLRVPTPPSDEPGSASPGGKPSTWTVVGFLKVATKKLYLNDGTGQLKAVTPLCVLDFYVVEGRQRQGHGKTLFQVMLERENASPEDLAYDRPSPRMRAFLAKNYGLVEAHAQPNNYVLFRAGSTGDAAAPRRPGSSGPTSPESTTDLAVPRSTSHSLDSVVAQINRLPTLPGVRSAVEYTTTTQAGARRTRPSSLPRSTPILPHLAASSPWTTVGMTARR